MSTTNPSIPADTAAHVLSHFGRGGYPAGDWTESLITLIDRADMTNRAKLVTAFPEVGAAVLLAKYDEEGIATLQRIAGLQVAPLTCSSSNCWNAVGPFDPKTGRCEDCIEAAA
ncbi:hypothetical protein [Streptomyces sp. cg35]|uniref:hypothetical protein n=1 Tax=Streptomyces sp. cg35 TaxID=3421650 RepID=UPI003D1635C3